MIALVVLCLASLGKEADPTTYLSDLTAMMRVDWPKNRTINIVCHGHSVPAGYARTPEVKTFDAYPYLLHRRLAERFPHAVINVVVTAIGGENSESGAKRFKSDVLSLQPDLVTIDYSLNDRGIGLNRARKAWVEMIQEAEVAKVKLILLTPTPDQGAKLDDSNDPLNLQGQQVRELAKEFGVGLADSLAAFKVKLSQGTKLVDLMAQSNHPNRAGHELVAAELSKWFP